MPIEPQKFMLYWAVGTVALAVLLFRRPRRNQMRLRLKGGGVGKSTSVTVATPPPLTVATPPSPTVARPRERSLNVIFNYNGHSWDAHEVLGVAAGSSLDQVRAGFTEAVRQVDPTSRPFVEAAYRAILEDLDRTA